MTTRLHIGFDDTDSPRKGCTTYIAALLVETMRKLGAFFIDYPNLIRLNPNVPWKTRGNGALCLRILCEDDLQEEIRECVFDAVEEHADLGYKGTDPGVVLLKGEVPCEISTFAQRAITGLVQKDEALSLIRRFNAEAVGFKKGRGIVGGLAAIGERLNGDHTYEFIAYRKEESRGTPRRVDPSSVTQMDKQLGRLSFNNVDPETNRILITPRGPDPILYGIRGEDPDVVRKGHEMVVTHEPIERWIIFRTNQGTDAHLKKASSVTDVRPHSPVIIKGELMANPRVIRGGHVIFQIEDQTGRIDCAAYKPTGRLRDVAKMLREGDLVGVYGGVRPPSLRSPITVNLEKIGIIKLAPNLVLENPLCPVCGKRMKSMGRGQGFECTRCGFHGRNLKKTVLEAERSVKLGIHVTSPRSQRHLTKPLARYGLEKKELHQSCGRIIPYEAFSSR